MTPLTILHEAEIELWEAVTYYENQSPGLGADFQREVETSLDVVSRFPDRWPVRQDGARRCMVHRFPYLIVYVVLEDQVWVIAIAHCKRRPDYWSGRIPRRNPSPPDNG